MAFPDFKILFSKTGNIKFYPIGIVKSSINSLYNNTIQYNTIQYKILLATKHSAMLMAKRVIKWKVFLSKRSNVHSHTAPSATRLQNTVVPALTQRNCDALTSVVRSSGDVFMYK